LHKQELSAVNNEVSNKEVEIKSLYINNNKLANDNINKEKTIEKLEKDNKMAQVEFDNKIRAKELALVEAAAEAEAAKKTNSIGDSVVDNGDKSGTIISIVVLGW